MIPASARYVQVGAYGEEGNAMIVLRALAAAWAICTAILLSGRYAGKFLGAKALSALESLMGLLLTTMAVEMIIAGIKYAFLSK